MKPTVGRAVHYGWIPPSLRTISLPMPDDPPPVERAATITAVSYIGPDHLRGTPEAESREDNWRVSLRVLSPERVEDDEVLPDPENPRFSFCPSFSPELKAGCWSWPPRV